MSSQDHPNICVLTAAILVVLASVAADRVGASTQTFVGQAVSEKGELLYIERHAVVFRNGQVAQSRTTYRDHERRLIGRLDSDFAHGPQFGSYIFKDLRSRYQDGVKVHHDHLRLFRDHGGEQDADTKKLPRQKDQVVGQGFHHFVAAQLEDIARGKVIPVRMVLPSRLEQYEFRIRKRKIEGDTIFIRLEIDNWFLRLFAPHVDVEYDLKTRQLLRYEGIANLADAAGQYRKVTITYTYPKT